MCSNKCEWLLAGRHHISADIQLFAQYLVAVLLLLIKLVLQYFCDQGTFFDDLLLQQQQLGALLDDDRHVACVDILILDGLSHLFQFISGWAL